jgi:hypothetical protein
VTKSYRSRTLNRRCQIAKADAAGNPLRDEQGNFILNHNGQWFFIVSGNSHQDRKRVIPVDPEGFFPRKAEEIQEALKAWGVVNAAVTPAMVYQEYCRVYTRPSETYAVPDHPEKFSLVLGKQLCVNEQGSYGGGNHTDHLGDLPPEETAIFARLAAQAPTNGTTVPNGAKPARKPRRAEEQAFLSEDISH